MMKIHFNVWFSDKILPPLFPSQIHIQHGDIKMPIMPAHQSVPQQQQHSSHQHQLVAHAQQLQSSAQSNNSHHAHEVHVNAPTPQPNEHYITVSQNHSTHLPHVSNLSRHINARYTHLFFSNNGKHVMNKSYHFGFCFLPLFCATKNSIAAIDSSHSAGMKHSVITSTGTPDQIE